MIKMSNIRKIYSTGKVEVEALKDVNVEIGKNEFLAIMGPSGSGKSTLMNLIGCLDTPTAGEYQLEGKGVQNLNRSQLAEIRNQKIGFVFQSFNLLPYATALENVEMPLIFAGIPARKRKNRVMGLLEQVGLMDRAAHKPTELSGGEMQRVAIARALANRPPLILADEPTGNLDSNTGREILKLFQDLSAQGHTLLIITHDNEIARQTQRVIKLRDGQIVGN